MSEHMNEDGRRAESLSRLWRVSMWQNVAIALLSVSVIGLSVALVVTR